MGGLARRASAIESIRQESADILLFDAGNCWWGAPGLSLKSQARVNVAAMNEMAYEAMVLGPSDLLLDESELTQRISEAHFAVLSANLLVRASGEPLVRAYTVFESRGRRVAVLGLTASTIVTQVLRSNAAPEIMASSLTSRAGAGIGIAINDDLVVTDPYRALVRYLGRLRSADVVVVISNLGWPKNVELAQRITIIDLIISAGAAEDLATRPWRSPSGVWLCQAGVSGQRRPGEIVAEVYPQLNAAGNVTQAFGSQTVLSPGVRGDPQMVELLRSFRQ